jgi:hypothetical protein
LAVTQQSEPIGDRNKTTTIFKMGRLCWSKYRGENWWTENRRVRDKSPRRAVGDGGGAVAKGRKDSRMEA